MDEQPHWYQLQETTGLAATSKPLRSRPIDLELNGKTTGKYFLNFNRDYKLPKRMY